MTTGAPQPIAAAAVAPPIVDARAEHRPHTAWVAWVVTPLVVLLLSGALDAVDQAAPEVLGGTSARYVPPDGHRSVSTDASGTTSVAEASRSTGIEGVFAAPTIVAATLFDREGVDELAQAQWWRSSYVDEFGERGTDLFRLSDEGITQVASWGGSIGFLFDPPIVLLPPEVLPGDTWSSQGEAVAGGALTYTATFAALRADGPYTDLDGREIPLTGGCIGTDSTIVIANADASLSTTLARSAVWCPGRAVVWSSGTIDDQPSGSFELRPAVVPFTPTDARLAPVWTTSLDDSSRLLPGRELPLQAIDPFFGVSEVTGQYRVPPSVTGDGRLVTVNDQGDDVQVWDLDRMAASLSWFGHPGGTVVSVGAVGDLVVATTAQRRVVAYDPDGRRVWSWNADELVFAPPVAVSGSAASPDVIVAARSGTVTRLDAESGVALWSQPIDADARTPVVIAADLVFVADERDRLTALDVTTGAIVWQNEIGPVSRMAADAATGLVAVTLESGSLVALEGASGVERWRTPLGGAAVGVVVSADGVVAMSEEVTLALDGESGRAMWRGGGGVALVADERSSIITLVQPRAIELRSILGGDVIDRLEIDASAASSSVFARAVGVALVVLESNGVLRRWELRESRGDQ
ncbi:MAG: hypothetical protein RLZZ608_1162 [Actinomycetota bacterium]